MKKFKLIFAVLFSNFLFSNQEVDLDSPEGWGMAYDNFSAKSGANATSLSRFW